MHADPKSATKLLNLTVFLALLGSAFVKAALKTLVKLTPDLDSLKANLLIRSCRLVQPCHQSPRVATSTFHLATSTLSSTSHLSMLFIYVICKTKSKQVYLIKILTNHVLNM